MARTTKDRLSRSRSGFTLIEIVVVLAIASLILAMVLLEVGNTQRAVRDNTRKQAVGAVEDALETYALTHGNTYTDQNTGQIVTVSDLYGDCTKSGATPEYLECGVTAPSVGIKYIPAPGDPDADGKFDMISITDRSGGTSGTGGYCVRVSLESLKSLDQAYGVSDINKVGHQMNDTGACS